MPVDKASATVVVGAGFDDVLAVVRDIESQLHWVKEIRAVELLEEYEDGLPATARFEASTGIGEDAYTLAYEHADDAMTWTLVQGRLQKRQDGAYALRDLGDDGTEVSLSLTIEHSISAPGFVRRRIFTKFVNGTVSGLKGYVEAGAEDQVEG